MEVSNGTQKIAWEYLGTEAPSESLKAAKIGSVPEKKKAEVALERMLPGNAGIGASSRAVYKSAEGGVDIDYSISANRLKENIIVKEPAEEYKYYFAFNVDSFDMKLSDDNSRIEFYKRTQGVADSKPDLVMPSPFMYDAEGERSEDVYYNIEEDTDGGYIFSVNANAEWINAKERVFPVTIDPQITDPNEYSDMIRIISEADYYEYNPSYCENTLSRHVTTESPAKRIVKNTSEHKESIKFIIDTNEFVDYENMKKHICGAELVIPVTSYELQVTGSSVWRQIYVNGVQQDLYDSYSAITEDFRYDITGLLEENLGSEITVEISSKNVTSIEFSSTADPYVEITYESKTYANRATVELNPMERVKATVDLTTGEQEIDFEDISDATLGIGISHHYKKTSSIDYMLGDNFKLNIDETLKPSGSNYVYTDPKGDVHTLKEEFYRVDFSGARVGVNKSEVVADADGKLWSSSGSEVKRELVSKDGYRAVSDITGVTHCELIETRGDEEKQIEEKMKAYDDSLGDFVLANKESGAIEHRCESAENYEVFIANATDGNLLLTEAEAISYKSLKLQHEALGHQITAYDNQIDSLADSNTSLSRTIANIADQKGMIDSGDDEKYSTQMEILDNQITLIGKQRTISEKQIEIGQLESQLYPQSQEDNSTLRDSINDLYEDITNLQTEIVNLQINTVTKQRTLYDGADDQNYYTWMEIYERQELDAEAQQALIEPQTNLANNQKANTAEQKSVTELQINMLIAKSEEYKELAANYYKEYVNLSIQLESIRRQIPVSYLISDSVIKGYNKNGELVIIQDKHEKYIAVERGEFRNGVVRVLSITDEKGRGLKFDYENDSYARLKSITNTKGETVSYEYDGYYLKSVKYPNGEILNLTYNTNKNRVINIELISSDGESVKYNTAFSYNADNYLNTVTTSTNISSVENGSTSTSSELITLAAVNIDYTAEGAIVKQAGEPDRIYVYDSTGLLNKYFEAVGGKVTLGEAYTYSSEYIIKTKTQYLASHVLNRTAYTKNFVFTVGEEESVTLNNFYDATTGRKVKYSASGAVEEEANTEYTYNSDRKVTLAKTAVKKKNAAGVLTDYCTAIERNYYNTKGELIRKESYIEGEELISGINTEEHIYDEKGYEIKSYKYNSLDSSSKFYKESELDEDGKLLADYDSTGEHKTEYEYESDGITVKREKLPDGSKFSYGRDAEGEVTAITHSTKDGEGSSVERHYTADLMTRLKSGNNDVKYSYDAKHRLTSADLNDIPEYINYTYSGDNTDSEKTVAVMKDGSEFTRTKNSFGNVKSESVRNKNNSSLPTLTTSYTYNADNLVTKVTDSVSGNISYTYDTDGRVTRISAPSVTEEYTYDGEKNLTSKSETVNNSKRTYTYSYKETAARELEKISVDGIEFEPRTDVYGRNKGKSVSISEEKCAEEQITYLKFGDRATNIPSTVRYGNKVNGKFVLMDSLKYDSVGNPTAYRGKNASFGYGRRLTG